MATCSATTPTTIFVYEACSPVVVGMPDLTQSHPWRVPVMVCSDCLFWSAMVEGALMLLSAIKP